MKRSAKTLILLAALLLCVGGYYLLNQGGETATVNEETGTFDLTAHQAEDLTGLQWSKDDTDYHFVKENDTWVNANNSAFPVDQTAVQALADDLANLTATRKLEDVADLSAYGLETPAFAVTATWADASTTTFGMGDSTPFADGYYLTIGQENIAYTIASSLSAMFSDDLNDLAQMEDIPAADTVTRLTVGATLDVTYTETSATVNENQHWYDEEGHALDGIDSLVSSAQGIAWKTLVDPACEDLAAYGLDEESATVLTLYNGEEAVLSLLIGGTDDSGNYYARLPESSMVYTVASSSVSTLLTTATESLLSTALVETAYANVQQATFTMGETAYELVPLHTQTEETEETTEAEDSAEEPEATETPDDPGEDVWALLTAITASGHTTEPMGEILLTVALTTADGNGATVIFAEHDVDNYIAAMDSRTLLVPAADVDKLIRAIKAQQ